MAKPSETLIEALVETAKRLEDGENYHWGHLGACNCGHLTQTLTGLSADEIHRRALGRAGDWGEVSQEYCDTSGTRVDILIRQLLDAGLTLDDIQHLEELDDPRVLRHLPQGFPPYLKRNERPHAVAYFRAWATALRGQLKEIG